MNNTSAANRPATRPLSDRLALHGLNYAVPARANRLDFMLGALTLVSLTLLTLTGIVLTQYYNPTPLGAHGSVSYIITSVPLASFLRDLHVWSASAALALVFAHLAAVFWRGGFRYPREGLWWSGVLLLAVLFGLAFTGSILTGDQEAVEALAHATAGAGMAGPLGAPLMESFTPSSPLLTRLYGVHVSVLPLALVGILALHLWLIRHLGVSAQGEERAMFRSHLRPLSGFAMILVALIAVVALVAPRGLMQPGVPGVELTKPMWPFLWIYAAENIFGLGGMVVAPALFFGFLALVPLSDRGEGRGAKTTRVLGVALFTIMVVAIIWAALAPAQEHLGM